MPAIAFVNKLDREGASLERSLASLRSKLGVHAVPVQLPIGSEDKFIGVVDLIGMNKIMWPHAVTRAPPVPMIEKLQSSDPLFGAAISSRTSMLEKLAEADEEIMDKYVTAIDSGGTDDGFCQAISAGDALSALRRACIGRTAVPVLCGASLKGRGVEPLLDAACCFLPSPLDRAGVVLTAVGKSSSATKTIAPTSSPPMVAFAFKIVYDKSRGGALVFVRVFSGELHSKDVLLNTSKGVKERANQLFRVSADDLTPIDKVSVGDIGCIVGLKGAETGDTLVVDKSPLQSYVLAGVQIPDAVFSLSIEPEKSSQQEELEKALELLCLEDPSLRVNLDPESGQILLSGIGELHLEIVCDKLRRQFGLPVNTGRAYVAYRESMDTGSGPITTTFKYERVLGGRRMFAAITAILTPKLDVYISGNRNNSGEIAEQRTSLSIEDSVRKILSAAHISALEAGVRGAVQRGPHGYPLVGVDINVQQVEIDSDTLPGAIQACIASLIDDALRNSGSGLLLEPIMQLEADVPQQYTGDVLSDISVQRVGEIREVVSSSDGARSTIIASVPLASMLGYATAIRSMTKGDCTFSMEYIEHQRVVDLSKVLQ